MISSSPVPWGRVCTQAVVAGVAGAILMDAFLWPVTVSQGGSMPAVWQWIASTAFGKGAFANPAFVWVGLALHVCVSVGWTGGYAFLASTRPFLNRRWPISGFVYGVVVYLLMQIVLLVDGNFVMPAGAGAVAIALVAHCIFFGIPVAFVVRAMQPRAAA